MAGEVKSYEFMCTAHRFVCAGVEYVQGQRVIVLAENENRLRFFRKRRSAFKERPLDFIPTKRGFTSSEKLREHQENDSNDPETVELDIEDRIVRKLRENGITKIDELRGMSLDELTALDGIGQTSATAIIRAIANYDIQLREEV